MAPPIANPANPHDIYQGLRSTYHWVRFVGFFVFFLFQLSFFSRTFLRFQYRPNVFKWDYLQSYEVSTVPAVPIHIPDVNVSWVLESPWGSWSIGTYLYLYLLSTYLGLTGCCFFSPRKWSHPFFFPHKTISFHKIVPPVILSNTILKEQYLFF